ncbi:MAG: DUF5104 domain-containing protein [Oscillospiraceae bacterium]|jgi:hypothetical protein|nr:DUF5104 domain-containing protein [Oscillospiraceae bacterium]
MKKKIIILLLAGVMLLTSCGNVLENLRTSQLIDITTEENAKIQLFSSEILKCFEENDRQGLKAMFCEQIRTRSDLDGEIDKLFEYFGGDSYYTRDIIDSKGGGESFDHGKRVGWDVRAELPFIEVTKYYDNGEPQYRYYNMWFSWCVNSEASPAFEGLQYIRIELLNTDDCLKAGEDIGRSREWDSRAE